MDFLHLSGSERRLATGRGHSGGGWIGAGGTGHGRSHSTRRNCGLEHFFPYVGTIIPIDFHIFRGVETTNQDLVGGLEHEIYVILYWE